MKEDYDVTITVRVNDPEQLLAAALAHADAVEAGMTRADFLNDADDSIIIEDCLTMLLDPGSLPGCKILGSGAEYLEMFDVDFGDERN
jgi:hypothetical protein